jgi:hypothetical protein
MKIIKLVGTDEQKVDWLNERDPFHQWAVGDDIYCFHCEKIFKAENVVRDKYHDPNCPHCVGSSPMDFIGRGSTLWPDDL